MRLVLFLSLLSFVWESPRREMCEKRDMFCFLPAFYLSLDKIGSGSA